MKRLSLIIVLLFLTACQSPTDSSAGSNIDWQDFVQLNGVKYQAASSTVVLGKESIGKEAGQIDHNLNQNVSDKNYQAKDGDAAYLKKGTKLYHVQDNPNLLATPDANAINDYKVYISKKDGPDPRYAKLDPDLISHVEIYEGDKRPRHLNNLAGKHAIRTLTDLLDEGEKDSDFSPDTSGKGPTVYHLVFYTADSPVAHRYRLFYDGNTWYWKQDTLKVLPDEIAEVILAP